jgi:RNA recognition motif-containing protein
MNIYVGNLPYDTGEADLQTAFAPYGSITRARIVTDRESGRSRGFGFVEMASDDEGRAAIEAMNGTKMGGRTLVVNEARPRA